MSEVARATTGWPAGSGHELKAERIRRRQSQAQCANVIGALGDGKPPRQTDVSKWELGNAIPRASRQPAVNRYIRGEQPEDRLAVVSPILRLDQTEDEGLTKAEVERLIVTRFGNGQPLSPQDGDVFRWIRERYKLDDLP